jgi:hypothetical protein
LARLTNIKLRRSATAGNVPTTSQLDLGELALNTYDGKLYMKKSVSGTDSVIEVGGGGSQQSGVWSEYVYTATSNQTSFSGSDDNSQTLSYVTNYLQVFLNGILLDNGTDYTANTTTSVVLTNGASAGDTLQISTFVKVLGTADISVDTFTPNGSTATFTLSENPEVEENIQVYIDGVYQEQSTYSVSGNTLTLDANPASGTTVEVSIGTRNLTLANLEDLTMTGDLTAVAGTFSGAITGNLTGNASGSAGTATSLSNHNTGALTEGSNLYYTDERVDDRVGALIVGGTGITATYNDAAGTLTLDGSAQYGDSDVGTYLTANSYATETYVGTQVSNLVASAPGALDTLNELAAAIGDDASFSTTITNSIATKLPLAGGTLTGTLNGTTASFSNTVTATNGFIGNVTGNITGSAGTVSSISAHDTGDLSEGSNLYYTDARADARITAADTGDLSEGSNLYYTNERVDDRVAALVVAGTNITTTYNDAAGTLTINSSGKTQEEIEDIVDGLLTAGAGIGLTYNDSAGTLTVTNTQLGANAFGNIVVSGQSTVAADSTNDTLTLVGQNGVTITTNAGSDTVTIDGHTSYAPFNTDLFTANGTDTTFVLGSTPSSEDNLIVFVEGVYQNKNSFSLSGSTLTISPAVPNTQEIVVHQIGDVVSGVGLLRNNFTGDGSTTDFTLSQDPLHEDNLFIYSDGVYQEKGEFSVSGTTLSFTSAPASGDSIEVIVPKMTEIQQPSTNTIDDAAQFNTNNIIPNAVTTTVVASASATTIASHAAATYRTVKYLVQCTQGTDYHATEVNLIHDGTTVYITEYGSLWDNAALGTFDATISGGNILLQITAGSASSMTTKVISTAVPL